MNTSSRSDNSNEESGQSECLGSDARDRKEEILSLVDPCAANPLDDPIVRTTLDRIQISGVQLINMSVKELNRRLAGCSNQIVARLKKCRRTLKNRGYAKNCRVKRIVARSNLERVNARLLSENMQLKSLNRSLVSRLNELMYAQPKETGPPSQQPPPATTIGNQQVVSVSGSCSVESESYVSNTCHCSNAGLRCSCAQLHQEHHSGLSLYQSIASQVGVIQSDHRNSRQAHYQQRQARANMTLVKSEFGGGGSCGASHCSSSAASSSGCGSFDDNRHQLIEAEAEFACCSLDMQDEPAGQLYDNIWQQEHQHHQHQQHQMNDMSHGNNNSGNFY